MKKVLLLLWKVSLISLGGMDTLRQLKGNAIYRWLSSICNSISAQFIQCKISLIIPDEYRRQNNLDPVKEDTLEVARFVISNVFALPIRNHSLRATFI